MDNTMIISLLIIFIAFCLYISYNLILLKKNNDSTTVDIKSVLTEFLIDIVRITQTAIEITAINPNDFDTEDEYKNALSEYVSEELKVIIDKSDISDTIKNMLSHEVLVDFIIKSYDIIGDISGTNKELKKINTTKN